MSVCKRNRAVVCCVELEDAIRRGTREDSTEERMAVISEARKGHVSRVVAFVESRVGGN